MIQTHDTHTGDVRLRLSCKLEGNDITSSYSQSMTHTPNTFKMLDVSNVDFGLGLGLGLLKNLSFNNTFTQIVLLLSAEVTLEVLFLKIPYNNFT